MFADYEIKSRFTDRSCYTCSIQGKNLPYEVDELNFVSKHLKNLSFDDVKWLHISEGFTSKIPRNLGGVFKNLTKLNFYFSFLEEISKENMREFPNLESLVLSRNELRFLPGDLFECNKKLKRISFENNKILFIGPELLDGLEIEYADFRGNIVINCLFDEKKEEKMTLSQLKQKIKEKCQPPRELLMKIKKFPDALVSKLLDEFIKEENDRRQIKFDMNFNESFVDDLKKIFTRNEFKDLTIKIGEANFKVQKLIFIARCPKVAELISKDPEAKELVLTEISPESFKHILSFIYTDEPPKDSKSFREIFVGSLGA